MAIPPSIPILSLFLSLSVLHFALVSSLSRFSPIDNYLLNCGSTADATVDGRGFIGDSSRSAASFLSASRSVSIRDENPPVDSLSIYHTARVFTRPSKYAFGIRSKGTHMVRLHFSEFDSAGFSLRDARFHVSVHGFLLLNNFTGGNSGNPRIKEYLIWVDSEMLEISLVPAKGSKFAFVNAIEVISAPNDLIADTAQFIDQDKVVRINELKKQAFETVFRVTVGGPKVTPFNDSLWRTWVPDNEFLKSSDGSSMVYFSGRIRYRTGGASREICPDNVYNSARVVPSKNATVAHHNITWAFQVDEGYEYLIRTHFCDIASVSLGLLCFNVYVNGHLAYQNLDLSVLTSEVLASPFYADFVVNGDKSGVLTVSVGPSNESSPYGIDAILNGVEIMKMNNSMGSFDGRFSAESILKGCNRGSIGLWVPTVAAVFMLLAASVLLQRRRRTAVKDSVAWSPLPTDVSEVDLKHCSLK